MKKTVREDMERIMTGLSTAEKERLKDSAILITGGAGFIGFYLVSFLSLYKDELKIKRIIVLDNFLMGRPAWLTALADEGKAELSSFNVITDNIAQVMGAKDADYVFHAASVASPLFYRKHPIETLDANVWGLRHLLDFYSGKPLRGLAFFSSSEIYGDPTEGNIPTPETYRGNVDCQGPRACYDEAKRFGETLCYLFNKAHNIPISIIRPFNNYGPGMRLNDARVVADFANAVRLNRDIEVYSDGSPTRTFCYISDAVTGYIKAVLHAADGFEAYNIGCNKPEISIKQLSSIYIQAGKEMFGYTGKAVFASSTDTEYLTNCPNRRCPNIDKAKRLLGYEPKVEVSEGVARLLGYIKESKEEELVW